MVSLFGSVSKKLSKTFGSLRPFTANRSPAHATGEYGTDAELVSLLPLLQDDGFQHKEIEGSESAEEATEPAPLDDLDDEITLPVSLPHPDINEIPMSDAEAAQLLQNLKNAHYEIYHAVEGCCEYCGDNRGKLHVSPTEGGGFWDANICNGEDKAECLFDFDSVVAEKREEVSGGNDVEEATKEMV